MESQLEWTGADGTTHEVSRDYALRILKWVFDTHGDVDMDAVIEASAREQIPEHIKRVAEVAERASMTAEEAYAKWTCAYHARHVECEMPAGELTEEEWREEAKRGQP